MKEFKLLYLDFDDNVLTTSTIQAVDWFDAYAIRDRILIKCTVKYCVTILVVEED